MDTIMCVIVVDRILIMQPLLQITHCPIPDGHYYDVIDPDYTEMIITRII